MDLDFNKEQEMLRKSVTEFLAKECPFETVKELEDSEEGYSSGLWKKMANLGWMEACFPEEYGGLGLDQLHYAPNGLPSFSMAQNGYAVLEQYSLKPKEYFLFVGRLVPQKGVYTLIKAFLGMRTSRKLLINTLSKVISRSPTKRYSSRCRLSTWQMSSNGLSMVGRSQTWKRILARADPDGEPGSTRRPELRSGNFTTTGLTT